MTVSWYWIRVVLLNMKSKLVIPCIYYKYSYFFFFYSPLTLLKNTQSTFYQMCQKSGEFDTLLEVAKAKHNLIDTEF
jgi:hypothetical protein